MPRFASITTIGKHHRYFPLALKSISSQNSKFDESVVISATSSDNNKVFKDVSKLDCDVNIIGMWANKCDRNYQLTKALNETSCDWSIIVDSDDLLPLSALLTVKQMLQFYPKTEVFFTDQYYLDVEGFYSGPFSQNLDSLYFPQFGRKFKQKHLWGCKTDLLRELMPLIPKDYICEDVYLFYRFLLGGYDITYIPKPLYFWRRWDGQMNSKFKYQMRRMLEEVNDVTQRTYTYWNEGRKESHHNQIEYIKYKAKELAKLLSSPK